MIFQDDFRQGLSSHWQQMQVGEAGLELTGGTLRLVNQETLSKRYNNAQIDDYQTLPRHRFPWRPPLTLTVRARFSHPGARPAPDGPAQEPGTTMLAGTAGFGFWNDPFWMTGRPLPALPQAIWFFYASPPSNMKLDLKTPGCGWKAATIDASRWPFLALAPTIPIAVPLMNLPFAYRRLWPWGQRAIQVAEAPVATDMTGWHSYLIHWGHHRACFQVDDQVVLDCQTAPRGPLGLVIWLDNQYMIVTPQGRLGHGTLSRPQTQWLELDWVKVEPLPCCR